MLKITSRKDYRRLSESPKKKIGKFFLVVFLEEGGINAPKVGMTVSKKIGNAVIRNKIKRRIRAFLREYNFPEIETGCLINIIALPIVTTADWISFKQDLSNLLNQVAFELKR